MRIAHITCAYPPYRSGISNTVRDIVRQNISAGHDVRVFTPDYRRSKSDGLDEAVLLRPAVQYGNAAFLPQLLWRLAGFDAVVVHYPFFGGAETAWLGLAGRKKPKLVVHFHMDASNMSPVASLLKLPLLPFKKLIMGKASKIVCASLDYAENSSVSGYMSARGDKFVEIPFGVDLDRFCPVNDGSERLKRVLFVGGLDTPHAFKGVGVLLEAFAAVCRQGRDWTLDIVGEGDLKESYIRQAEGLGLGERVRFLGSVSDSDLSDIFRRSGIFVLPSVSANEAFGKVLLEALASGVPVIASDLPGVRSVFMEGIHGLKAKPGDVADLSGKIGVLIDNDAQRDMMAREARRHAEDRYDWNRIGALYNKMLEETVG